MVLTVIFVRLWAYIAESEALMVYGHGQPPQHLPNLLLILVTAQHCTCTLMIYYEMQMFIVAAFNIMFMWPVKFFCYTMLDSCWFGRLWHTGGIHNSTFSPADW